MGGERSFRKDPRTFTPSYAPQSAPVQNGPSNGELKKQIEAMSAKLDKLVVAVQELTLKDVLKEVTDESKETPKPVEETKAKKSSKKKQI